MIYLTQLEEKEGMDILDNLKEACIASSLVFLLFKTNFLYEYITLFKLGKYFRMHQFKCSKIKDPEISYFEFLNQKSNSFLTRLISCPYCLGFWVILPFGLEKCNFLITYCFYLLIIKFLFDERS